VADGDIALLAVEFARVLTLEDGIVEHARRADEVDAMVGQVPPAMLVLPLEHTGPLHRAVPGPSRGL
jgi:hypothetical protein